MISLSAPSRVAFALGGLLHISVMASNRAFCGCCSRRAIIIAFALTGVCLLATGLVLRLGNVFNKIIKEKVDQASFLFEFIKLNIANKIWVRVGLKMRG